jgi:hypothetical protein
VLGAILSAGGLTLVVFGILQSSQSGWVIPKRALTIGGTQTGSRWCRSSSWPAVCCSTP